ncbi:MAG: sulfite exporter TauE/SafE family protein [Desulfobulbaceae bacterium]
MQELLLLSTLTLVASLVGTMTGFGTSTIMVPVLLLFLPLPVTLLFVGVIHFCGDIWKVLLFRSGFDRKVVLGFCLAGIPASWLGAMFSAQAEGYPVKRILGAFLICYTLFLFARRNWSLPPTTPTALGGGLLSGLCAGFSGVGGAVRGAFLTAFNLPPGTYVFTSGLIALFIDATRITGYLAGSARLDSSLAVSLLACIPLSFAGAWIAKRYIVDRLPRTTFRVVVGVFLSVIGFRLLFFP